MNTRHKQDNGQKDNRRGQIIAFLSDLIKETGRTSLELFKITIPVMIITKILEELGMISYLSMVLDPVMYVMGVPGEMGLVWATGMLTSLYGAMAVFAALAPSLDLTVLQVTIVCSILLIAHSLPIELSVSKRAGAPFWPVALMRVLGAVVYGVILNRVCLGLNIWQSKAEMLFKATASSEKLAVWAQGQVVNLFFIVIIIFAILIAMQLLKYFGVLNLLEKMLNPILPYFGMSSKVAPITVVGMVMGIGYGGALIIREAQKGQISKKEILNSMILMGLCHGLVEDTLCMFALGGKLGGILYGRIVFSLVITYVFVFLMEKMSNTSEVDMQREI